MNERVFYVERDTDLSELTSTLKNTRADTVIFAFPRKALLFESIVNIQILRSEAEKLSKSLVIVSSSAKGKVLCENAGVEFHPSLEHWEKKGPADGIEAKKNDPEEVRKIRRVPITVETKESKPPDGPKSFDEINWKELLSRPSWQALIALLLFSFVLFFFLAFLAFPGATIAIHPEKKGLEIITNVEIVNTEKNANKKKGAISGYPMESVFEKKIKFFTITKVFQGLNATGTLIVYNNSGEERRLRPTTRFQTESGIVFRATDWVIVPPASRNSQGKVVPGSRSARVVADEKDVYGEFVGEKGNLPPTRFFLPALTPSDRRTVWAESTEVFSGGKTAWSPQIQEADLEAAKKKIEADLLASVEQDFQNFIREKNAREQKDFKLLLGEKFLEKEILEVVTEPNILGTENESFWVSAKIRVRTWAYSEGELISLLWEELSSKVDPKMRLTGVDADGTPPELLERNEVAGFLKASITARGAEEFLIDPRSEAGIHFVNRVKSEILGKSIDEAEAILENQEEVSAVSISVWPFWSRKLPTLPANISVKLDESNPSSLE